MLGLEVLGDAGKALGGPLEAIKRPGVTERDERALDVHGPLGLQVVARLSASEQLQ